MKRYMVAMVLCAGLCACASKPVVSVPKPAVKSIAIVPATNPTAYTLDNRNAAIGVVLPGIAGLAYSLENRTKARTLTEKLTSSEFPLATDFTQATADALREKGYQVHVLENVVRNQRKPDSIEYEDLSFSADALLHVYFFEVGLYSPPFSVDYLPRVNATGTVFVKGHPHYLYDESLYYGVDAREGKKWAIMADAKFSYPDFESVIAKLDSVKAAFSTGAREIAKRMAEQIDAAIK